MASVVPAPQQMTLVLRSMLFYMLSFSGVLNVRKVLMGEFRGCVKGI